MAIVRPAAQMVKCAECGYLGFRHIESQQLVTPSDEHCSTGEGPLKPDSRNTVTAVVHEAPVCAVGLLVDNFDPSKPGPHGHHREAAPAAVRTIMHRERGCSQFTPRLPGLSPKEHIDMNFLERQQRFQAREGRRNLIVNVLLCVIAAISAIAAWWGALSSH
jgi:hypothetical protein